MAGFFSNLAGAAGGANDAQQAMQLLRLKLQQQATENQRAQQELDLRKQEASDLSADRQQARAAGVLNLQAPGSDVTDNAAVQSAAKTLGVPLTTQPAQGAVAAVPPTQTAPSFGVLNTGASGGQDEPVPVTEGTPAVAATPAKTIYPGTLAQQQPAIQLAREQKFAQLVADNPNLLRQQLLAVATAAGLPLESVAKFLPPEITGPALDNQAQALYAKKAGGQSLTPEEAATLTGYEDRKRVVSDPAQLAATARQTNTIAQQTAQQKRAQDFTEAQAARKEIADKIEQPYLDAQEKMNTLRDVVDAANGGNMEAASLTPLLATLGVVTSEGVKRINATEVQQVQGAGSLLDSIKGRWGKVVHGQPMDAQLQNDTLKLADMLEANAHKKYLAGLNATKTRYKDNPIVAAEEPLPGPEPAQESPEQRLQRLRAVAGMPSP